MAAVDYARLPDGCRVTGCSSSHTVEEILEQSRATFARAPRCGFGELWVGGKRPSRFEHVFASIQSLNASGSNQSTPRISTS